MHSGDARRAVEIWQAGGIELQALELRLWWYDHLGAIEELAAMNRAVSLFKNSPR